MLDAVEAGLEDKKRALGYLELGAKVLDKIEEVQGPPRGRASRPG